MLFRRLVLETTENELLLLLLMLLLLLLLLLFVSCSVGDGAGDLRLFLPL